ncbi:MAG TPA: DUF1156 domain-containing protein, partial [Candidatus Cloacimonadota bacterium]|nr:DUF1156 domain-containing protein [Candidatus Cloacimonadota bacterium]
IPLLRSFWLCNKAKKKVALKPVINRIEGDAPSVEFDIFEPKKDSEVHGPTVARAKATCLCCGSVLPPDRVRSQLACQNGGADVIFDQNGKRIGGARMLAVVQIKEKTPGRKYRLTSDADYLPILAALQDVARILAEWESKGKQGLCPFPDEPTPAGGGSGAGRAFSVQKYGIYKLRDLFTLRQLIAIHSLASIINLSSSVIQGMFLGKLLRHMNTLSKWHRGSETIAGAFGLNAMSTSWDFPEMEPFCDFAGSLVDSINEVISAVESIAKALTNNGNVA